MLVYKPFEVDESEFTLRRDGDLIPVQRQVLATLIHLMKRAGCLVTRQELLAGPWRGSSVSDAAIHRRIMRVRRAVDLDGYPNPVETIRGVGFRFTGTVEIVEPKSSRPAIQTAHASRCSPSNGGESSETEELVSRVRLALQTLEEAIQLAPQSGLVQALFRSDP